MDKPNEPSDEQRSYEIASRMLFLSARNDSKDDSNGILLLISSSPVIIL